MERVYSGTAPCDKGWWSEAKAILLSYTPSSIFSTVQDTFATISFCNLINLISANMLYTTASILAFAAAASAVTIPVQVGVVSPDKPNIFSPEDITAEVGDIIEFKFNPKITVTSRDPIWFYCSQTTGKHCQNGMVGAINAPKEGAKTLALYKEGAAALKNQNLTDTAPTTGKSQSIALPPPAAVQTSAAVAYTSGGSVYTSYTPTSYMTTATLSSTVTSVSGGTTATGAAGGAAASSSSTAQSGAAATGAPGSFFAAGAVVLGALAMI
ncbi:hypothetical protein M7I_7126 [Glarea lozoyensis 74030]|uniref:Cupredoxin n=1 Tax=Glarea lozoyensis (strain ATCC 74030 / MF5533) TaxID=1104152 RepID=H0EWG1_GLAL7|nr:hypothetical protein M7I_7126 [Glarea lozoyensis 74030]